MGDPTKKELIREIETLRAQLASLQGAEAERAQAAEALQASERRYRLLFEQDLAAVYRTTLDGRFLDFNRTFARTLGYESRDAIMELRASELYFKEVEREAFITRLREQGAPTTSEWCLRRKDGSRVCLLENVRLVEGGDGAAPFIQVIAVDITGRKQAEEAEREQRALAEVLRDTATALNSTLDLDEVLDRILANVSQVVPYDVATVMLIEGDIARVVRQRGFEKWNLQDWVLGLAFKIDETPDMRAMRATKQPVVTPDVNEAPGWVRREETGWIRSHAAMPIRLEGDVIGFLNLNSAEPGFFTETHAERLRAFADQVAIAIRNARLYEETKRQADEMTALYHTSLEIGSPAPLSDLLWTICDRAAKLLGVSKGGLYLRRDEDELELVVAYQLEQDFTGTRIRLGEGVAGRVVQSGQPLTVEHYASWEGRAPVFDSEPFASVIGVPLKWQERIIRAITLSEETRYRTFTPDDVRLLSLLAQQAAIAIEGTRLYERAQERSSRLALLNQIARAGAATLDMGELLQTLADTAAEIIGGDGCYITLWDAERQQIIPAAAYGPFRGVYASQPRPRCPSELTLTESAIRERRPLPVDDVFNTPHMNSHIAAHYSAHSILAVPLRADDRDLGALLIAFEQPHHFTEDEIDWAAQAGDLIALALAKTQAYAEIEARNIELDAFAHTVAHDLKTPLQIVIAAANVVYTDYADDIPEDVRVLLKNIETYAEKMNDMIQNLLLLATLRSGETASSEVAVAPVIEAALSRYEERIQERGIAVDVALAADLLTIRGHAPWLEAVFANLVENAIKYIDDDNPQPRLTIRGVRQGDMARFEVQDNGMGIAPADQEKLFKAGSRLHPQQAEGSGLGLSIAQRIVHKLDGQIGVESAPGKGSTFWFTLPSA